MKHATLLGGALHEDAVTGLLEAKLGDLKLMISRLGEIGRHEAFFLLRNCFAIPKLMYTLRTSSCSNCDILSDYDAVLRSGVEELLNCRLHGSTAVRAFLPVSFGGLGVRKASDVALPAFLSSYNGTLDLAADILSKVADISPDPDALLAETYWTSRFSVQPTSEKSVQKAWDNVQNTQILDDLLAGATTDEEKASINAACALNSGAWLRALPVKNLGLKLSDDQVRIASALRIGAKVCEKQSCICGAEIGENGFHPLSCNTVSGRVGRHNEVNSIVQRALNSAKIPAILEPPGLSRTDGKRPDGKSLVPWEQGRCVIWDFTCVDTVAPSNVRGSANMSGSAAKSAEQRKIAKYANLTNDYAFVPIAIETLGTWGTLAKGFIDKIGSKMNQERGDSRAKEFLIQSIAIAIARGNAECILNASRYTPGIDTYMDM